MTYQFPIINSETTILLRPIQVFFLCALVNFGFCAGLLLLMPNPCKLRRTVIAATFIHTSFNLLVIAEHVANLLSFTIFTSILSFLGVIFFFRPHLPCLRTHNGKPFFNLSWICFTVRLDISHFLIFHLLRNACWSKDIE